MTTLTAKSLQGALRVRRACHLHRSAQVHRDGVVAYLDPTRLKATSSADTRTSMPVLWSYITKDHPIERARCNSERLDQSTVDWIDPSSFASVWFIRFELGST